MPMPMPSFDSLLIIVPAYNEEAAVGGVVRAIHAAMPGTPVLVIDDCSMDATQAAAREAGARVLAAAAPLGTGRLRASGL
jgi:glycosyltransferase involved in cell wall biosynthesis